MSSRLSWAEEVEEEEKSEVARRETAAEEDGDESGELTPRANIPYRPSFTFPNLPSPPEFMPSAPSTLFGPRPLSSFERMASTSSSSRNESHPGNWKGRLNPILSPVHNGQAAILDFLYRYAPGIHSAYVGGVGCNGSVCWIGTNVDERKEKKNGKDFDFGTEAGGAELLKEIFDDDEEVRADEDMRLTDIFVAKYNQRLVCMLMDHNNAIRIEYAVWSPPVTHPTHDESVENPFSPYQPSAAPSYPTSRVTLATVYPPHAASARERLSDGDEGPTWWVPLSAAFATSESSTSAVWRAARTENEVADACKKVNRILLTSGLQGVWDEKSRYGHRHETAKKWIERALGEEVEEMDWPPSD
ncbi:hypothetical protein AAFC00_006453 [Neodothiora populina]|uniref:Uncharacterized protein n=1 Tax=Neodothiora populina TaxID=2781224 RepID=A0ABR3P5B1_9PEZI